MTLHTVKKLAIGVAALFLLLSFWNDPSGSAATCTNFIGGVGRFFSTVIDKSVQFVSNLG